MTLKVKHIFQGAINLIGLFLIGVVALISFSTPWKAKDTSFLKWPTNNSLLIHMKGSISITDITPFSNKAQKLPFDIELLASPQTFIQSPIYQLEIKRFKLEDANGLLIMECDLRESTHHHYKIDSRLSDIERKNILNRFNVNLDSQAIIDDTSILKERCRLALSSHGSVLEVDLGPQFKKMITENLSNHPIFPVISHMLTQAATLPSMIPSQKGTHQSDGFFVTPLTFKHEQTGEKSFKSTGSGSQTNGGTSINQAWLIDWGFSNSKEALPSSLDMQLIWNLTKKHYSSSSTFELVLNHHTDIEVVEKAPVIDVINIDDEFTRS